MTAPDNFSEEERLAQVAEADERLVHGEEKRAGEVYSRLLSRLRSGYIELPFRDGVGEFSVKMMVPSAKQGGDLNLLTAELVVGPKDGARAEAIGESIATIMAALCPEIPRDAWLQGSLGRDVSAKILRIAQGFEAIKDEELRFFRQPPQGQVPSIHDAQGRGP
jgi:hypothetical protein